MKIKLPKNVEKIIEILRMNKKKAFVVGGCIRDCVMGNEPEDWDIATSAKPNETAEIFREYRLVLTGIKHGTVGVIIENCLYEITSFRTESGYKDKRHPDSVYFTENIYDDLKRRDFTVNAIAYNDSDGILDPFNGLMDIKNRVIRCVGNPQKRFDEDALRILRCIRFAVRFNFQIEKNTSDAIINLYKNLSELSKERIIAEINKIFSYKFNKIISNYIPVFEFIIPYSNINKKNLKNFQNNIAVNFALIYENDINALKSLKLLKQSNKVINKVKFVLQNYNKVKNFNLYEAKKLLRSGEKENFHNTVLFYCAKTNNFENYIKYMSFYDEIVENKLCYRLNQMSINGNDILKLNIYNKNEIKIILEDVYEKVISDELINSKTVIMKYLERKFFP